jgi:hypothetical protein
MKLYIKDGGKTPRILDLGTGGDMTQIKAPIILPSEKEMPVPWPFWAGGLNMWHAWGRGEVFTGFWLGGPRARDHWEDLGVGGRITLKWALGR